MKKIILIALLALNSLNLFSQKDTITSEGTYLMKSVYAHSGRVGDFLNRYSVGFDNSSLYVSNAVSRVVYRQDSSSLVLDVAKIFYKIKIKDIKNVFLTMRDKHGNINVFVQANGLSVAVFNGDKHQNNAGYIVFRLNIDKNSAEKVKTALKNMINKYGGNV